MTRSTASHSAPRARPIAGPSAPLTTTARGSQRVAATPLRSHPEARTWAEGGRRPVPGGSQGGPGNHTQSLQITDGPRGSRTLDLRRAKAPDSVLYRHRETKEVADLQGNREAAAPGRPNASQRRPRSSVAEGSQTGRPTPLGPEDSPAIPQEPPPTELLARHRVVADDGCDGSVTSFL